MSVLSPDKLTLLPNVNIQYLNHFDGSTIKYEIWHWGLSRKIKQKDNFIEMFQKNGLK